MDTLEKMKAIRENLKMDIDVRHELDARRVIVGMGDCGIKAGARDVMAQFMKEFVDKKVEHTMLTIEGCIGKCDKEPIVEVIEKDGKKTTYGSISPDKVGKIVDSHLLGDKVVSEYAL